MADDWFIHDPDGPVKNRPYDPEEFEKTTVGDYGRAFASGAVGVAASSLGAIDYVGRITNRISREVAGALGTTVPPRAGDSAIGAGARALGDVSEGFIDDTSPAFRRAARARVLPTEGGGNDVFDSDVSVGTALGANLAMAAPSLLASMVPAGLVARAVGSTAGYATAAGTNAALNAGDTYNNIVSELGKSKHEDLVHSNPIYAGYISMGMSPADAKDMLLDDIAGYKPLLVGALSAATVRMGADRFLIDAVTGKGIKHGLVKGVGRGARGEALQEAIEQSAQTHSQELAASETGLRDADWRNLLDDSIKASVVGGVLGGAVGGATNIGGARARSSRVVANQITSNIESLNSQIVADRQKITAEPVEQAVKQPPAEPPAREPAQASGGPETVRDVITQRVRNTPVAPEISQSIASEEAPPVISNVGQAVDNTVVTVNGQTTAGSDPTAVVNQARAGVGIAPVATPEQPPVQPVIQPPIEVQPVQEPVQPVQQVPGLQVAPEQPVVPEAPVEIAPPVQVSVTAGEKAVAASKARSKSKYMTAEQAKADTAKQVAAVKARRNAMTPEELAKHDATTEEQFKIIQKATGAGKVESVTPGGNPFKGLKAVAYTEAEGLARASLRESVGSPDPDVMTQALGMVMQQARDVIGKTEGGVSTMLKAVEGVLKGAKATYESAEAARAETTARDEVARGEKAKSVAAERKISGAPQERERTKKGERKSVEGKRTESEDAFRRRMGRLAAEQRENAPDYVRSAQSAFAARKAVGSGTSPEQRFKRAAANKLIREAREAEIAADKIRTADTGDTGGDTGRQVVKKSKERDAAQDNEKAKQIITSASDVTEADRLFRPKTRKEGVTSMGNRLERIVQAAKAEGITIPNTVVEGKPDYLNFLAVIRDFSKRVKSGKVTDDELITFIGDELAAQTGDFENFYEHRKITNDALGAVPIGDEGSVGTQILEAPPLATPADFLRHQQERAEWRRLNCQFVIENDRIINRNRGTEVRIPGDRRATFGRFMEATRNMEPQIGVHGTIQNFIKGELSRVVGDVPTYVLTQDQMISIYGKSVRGLYIAPTTAQQELGLRGMILLEDSIFSSDENLQHVLVHEGMHAATFLGLNNDVRGVGQRARRLLLEITDVLDKEKLQLTRTESYGLESIHELFAEGFSNYEFQGLLHSIPISDELRAMFASERSPGLIQTLWDAFVSLVGRALGWPKTQFNALEALIRLGGDVISTTNETVKLAQENRRIMIKEGLDPANFGSAIVATGPGITGQHFMSTGNTELPLALINGVTQTANNVATGVVNGTINVKGKLREFAMRSLSLDQARQVSEHLSMFGPDNPLTKVADYLLQTEPLKRKFQELGNQVLQEGLNLQKKNPEKFAQMGTVAYGATVAGVYAGRSLAGNTHLGKIGTKSLRTLEGRTQHPELHRLFNDLPQEFQRFYNKMTTFYREMQNDIKLAAIDGIIRGANPTLPPGVTNLEVADWVFKGGLEIDPAVATARDVAIQQALGKELVFQLEKASQLRVIKGDYFPLMRDGDFVVTAKAKVKVPRNATLHEGNIVRFKTQRELESYMASPDKDLPGGARKRWVDATTGAYTVSTDPNSVAVYEAKLQNEYMEMFETEADAKAGRQDVVNDGSYTEISGIERRRDTFPNDGGLAPNEIQTLLRSIDQRTSIPVAMKPMVKRTILEASLKLTSASRVQKHRLPRRKVLGYSTNMLKTMHDYNISTSNHLAKLAFATDIAEELTKAMAVKEALKFQAPEGAITRDELLREFTRRVNDPFSSDAQRSKWVNTLLAISFIDKLASPMYSFFNSLQTLMVSLPVLGGPYGWVKAQTQLLNAYSVIGGGGIAKQGLKDIFRPNGTDFGKSIKDRIATGKEPDKARLVSMIEYLEDRGEFHRDAGLEIARAVEAKTLGGKILNKAEAMSRAMPAAVEANNRGATAVAAYRLAFEKTRNHAEALKETLTMVKNTQGDYSYANAPHWFNHPALRIVLQFKKYGQMMYYLLGQNIHHALKGATPAERSAARRTLGYLLGTHVLMAGTTGLPTEPLKLAFLALAPLGFPGWDDVEDWERKALTWAFGKKGGEIAAEGITRALPFGFSFDMSSRVGLDSLLTHGDPRKTDNANVKTWLFDTVIGAPGTLVGEWVQGIDMLTDGRIMEATEKLLPVKVMSDSLKAYRLATEGKKTEAGRETMEPLSLPEAVIQGLGATPSRVSEKAKFSKQYFSKKEEGATTRQKQMGLWLNASGAVAKDKAWDNIKEWNKGKTESERITMQDLVKSQRRRDVNKKKEVGGITPDKRSTPLLKELESRYGF